MSTPKHIRSAATTLAHTLRGVAVLVVAGLCGASACADLLPASLRGWANSYAERTGFDVTLPAPMEPLVRTYANRNGGAGVWSSYGVNKASSEVGLTVGTTAHDERIGAGSTWTDLLTIYTPDAPIDAWVHLRFNVYLDGFLEADAYGAATSASQVIYAMYTSGEGDWVVRPGLSNLISNNSRFDFDSMLPGDIAIRNGHTFSLISDLLVGTAGYLMGPPGASTLAQAGFGDTAQWMGGTVWIGDHQAEHFSITAASGHDYAAHDASAPEPATAWLALCGIAGLLAVRRSVARRGLT